MKVRTAALVAFVIFLGAFAALAQTPPSDEKTITFTLSPPFPDGGVYGHGCPASLPGGGTTEVYSSFMHTACCGFSGGRTSTFYFMDPLPPAARLKSIDVTVIGGPLDQT